VGDQSAQHGVGSLDVAQVPGAVGWVEARDGKARCVAEPLAEKLHRDWRHISFARVLRTPGCCRARLPRHRPRPGRPSLHCIITGLPGRQRQGPCGERAVFRPGYCSVSAAGSS
jgi:hypothetical protein